MLKSLHVKVAFFRCLLLFPFETYCTKLYGWVMLVKLQKLGSTSFIAKVWNKRVILIKYLLLICNLYRIFSNGFYLIHPLLLVSWAVLLPLINKSQNLVRRKLLEEHWSKSYLLSNNTNAFATWTLQGGDLIVAGWLAGTDKWYVSLCNVAKFKKVIYTENRAEAVDAKLMNVWFTMGRQT